MRALAQNRRLEAVLSRATLDVMEGTERRWGTTAVLLPPERGDRPLVPYEPVFYEYEAQPDDREEPRTVRLRVWQLAALVGAAALVGLLVGRAASPGRSASRSVSAARDTALSPTPVGSPIVPETSPPAGKAPAATAAPPGPPGTRLLLDLRRETGPKTTDHFVLTGGRWVLGWAYDCTGKGGQGSFQIMVYTPDGLPSREGGVNQRGAKGSSIAAYTSTGERYLGVQTNCVWAIRVTT